MLPINYSIRFWNLNHIASLNIIYESINIERAHVQILKNVKNYEKFNISEKKKKN